MRETPVPAQQPQAQEDARLPRSHAHPRRPRGHQVPPSPGPRQALGLSHIRPVRDRATFDALARARRHTRGTVTMRYVPLADADLCQVAIATTRATGNAVTRNRVRRRLRAAIAAHGDALGPGAYLFGGGADLATAPFDDLRDAVGELVRSVRETTS